jgi:hypothetical protein
MTATDVKNGTLTANTVATVTFTARYGEIEVQNLEPAGSTDTSIIYVTTSGVAPAVGGDDTTAVEPGTSVTLGNNSGLWYQWGVEGANGFNSPYAPLTGSQYAANGGTTVKLKSAGTPEYSVSGQG